MKKKALALTLVAFMAVSLSAQQTSSPDILTPQTAASVAFMAYKAWVETNISALWSANATVQSTAGQNTTDITALTARVAALEAKVAQPVSTAPITMHFEAESSNTPGIVAQSTTDVGGGQKIVLAAGQRLSFNILVPATKAYAFTARVGSDPGTLGSLSFHFETANANSGPMTASGGGTWITSQPGAPMALTAGPVAITFVVDSGSITGGSFYLNYAEAVSQ